jgi:two-component system copper resistance phosphate regulon response regulator CusR
VPRILLVEDEPGALAALERALKPLGHPIDIARNGSDAMQLLEQQEYALLVTDLMMPARTGFDILEMIIARKMKLPIVVCSAFVQEDALKGMGPGHRFEVVRKPFKPDAMTAAARRLLPPVKT